MGEWQGEGLGEEGVQKWEEWMGHLGEVQRELIGQRQQVAHSHRAGKQALSLADQVAFPGLARWQSQVAPLRVASLDSFPPEGYPPHADLALVAQKRPHSWTARWHRAVCPLSSSPSPEHKVEYVEEACGAHLGEVSSEQMPSLPLP